MPQLRAVADARRDRLRSVCRLSTTSAHPSRRSHASTRSTSVRSPSGTAGLATSRVSGSSRVPRPREPAPAGRGTHRVDSNVMSPGVPAAGTHHSSRGADTIRGDSPRATCRAPRPRSITSGVRLDLDEDADRRLVDRDVRVAERVLLAILLAAKYRHQADARDDPFDRDLRDADGRLDFFASS